MKIEAEIHYPRPPMQVSEMTFDPQFQDRKCAATGALSHTVDVTVSDDRTRITTERVMPTDAFPDFLKSFVGSSLTITQIDEWGAAESDGSRQGTISVSVAGTPLKFTGMLSLVPTTDGAVGRMSGDLKAGVPLIGSRVEKAAAPAVLAAVRAEEKTAIVWLAERD